MGKPKDTDYLYSTARVRALERYLLGGEQVERMLEAKSDEEASKILSECGYDGAAVTSLDRLEDMLGRERSRVFATLLSFVPHRGIIDVFRIKYDYHNLKAIIKAEALQTDCRHLMIDSGRFAPAILIDAVRGTEKAPLPKRMTDSIAEAADILARTSDPQLSDTVLDRACFAETLETAAKCRSEFLMAYVRLSVDSANLKTLVRSVRSGKSADFLRFALIDGGNVAPDKLAAFFPGTPLQRIFTRTPLENAAAYGDELLTAGSGATLSELESLLESALSAHLGKARMVPFGEAPIVAYIAAKEEEYAVIRTVFSGRLSGVSPDYIRSRLPSANLRYKGETAYA